MMAVAYFLVHAPQGFFPSGNGGKAAMLYCFIFLYFSVSGGGSWPGNDMPGSSMQYHENDRR
jgi:putative oxidoreductase